MLVALSFRIIITNIWMHYCAFQGLARDSEGITVREMRKLSARARLEGTLRQSAEASS